MQLLTIDKIIDCQTVEKLDLEPEDSAQLAGLKYVYADRLQIKRQKVGRGFS